jgi:hypothetical protein
MAVWYNLWSFWKYFFPSFACLDQEKSGNPVFEYSIDSILERVGLC